MDRQPNQLFCVESVGENMLMDMLNIVLDILNWVAYWANYRVHFTAPEDFTLPLALVGMLGFSLLILGCYSWREFIKRK